MIKKNEKITSKKAVKVSGHLEIDEKIYNILCPYFESNFVQPTQKINNKDSILFVTAQYSAIFSLKNVHHNFLSLSSIEIIATDFDWQIKPNSLSLTFYLEAISKDNLETYALNTLNIALLSFSESFKNEYPRATDIDVGGKIILEIIDGENGNSSFLNSKYAKMTSMSVIVVSKKILQGNKGDEIKKIVYEKMESFGVKEIHYQIIDDEYDILKEKISELIKNDKFNFCLFIGGTGLTPNDRLPQIIESMVDFPIPGIAEAIRSYGQKCSPYAMLSRSFAGIKNKKIFLAIPSSKNGIRESIDSIFPSIFHCFKMINHLKKE